MAIEQLQMVAKLEKDKEDKLVREFQQAQQHLQQNKQKMIGIENYRMEYLREMQNKGNTGITINSYGHFQAFITKLEEAMSQQSQIVSTAFQVVNQRKGLWLEQQRKRKAVDMLVDKHWAAQQVKANKAEQALLDEVATQRFFQARKARR
jgi:flagellar FliJ protein